MPAFVVRPYRSSDRQTVLDIMADTAFFGEPVEVFLEDRRLFCDAFCTYYTDWESEFAWVAQSGDNIAGVLLGCADTSQYPSRMLRLTAPVVLEKLLTFRYRLGRMSLRYGARLLGVWARKERPFADLALYPAHLHINVQEGWRGQGLGRKLLSAYIDQLKTKGIAGVHLETTNQNQAACLLYARMGFSLLDARPTQMWKGVVGEPVENRLYGLQLA